MSKPIQTAKRSETAPVQSEERSEDGELELPHELVGQYVDLGKRHAAGWKKAIGDAIAVLRARQRGKTR